MIALQEVIDANRFGYGIRPTETPFPAGLLAQLQSPDPADTALDWVSTGERADLLLQGREARRDKGSDSPEYMRYRDQMRDVVDDDFRRLLVRPLLNPRGFRERIFAFWIDHFTVVPKDQASKLLLGAYFDDAIRPNINRRFADLLKAAITHPSMILFLDQHVSFGPNSRAGKRRGRGLNENLAREILELHSLGVDGDYTQDDVRQFAELLTGLTVSAQGMEFVAAASEPGAETILGQSYGAGDPDLQNIFDFLEDLAMHPATANHLASKLAVHFIGPDPDTDYVDKMAQNYLDSDGDLIAMYDVLLHHSAARTDLGQKARTPFEYMVASLRVLQTPADTILKMTGRELRQHLMNPLVAMGQSPFDPDGPDGWNESLEYWITPPTLAARINWAGELAQNHATAIDPRPLLETVLGPLAPDDLEFAVAGAEAKWEGVALMLISPTFMRR